MKLYARIESEKGKVVGTGGDEYLDIDILVGNQRLAALTLRRATIEQEDGEVWALFDENDDLIKWFIKG